MIEIPTGHTGKRVAGASTRQPSHPDRLAHDAVSGANRRQGQVAVTGTRMVHTATGQPCRPVLHGDAGVNFGGRG